MPIYKYKARNNLGEIIIGEAENVSIDSLAESLIKNNIYPIDIEEKQEEKIKKKASIKDLLIFTRQFYILFRSGVPTSRALKSMETSSQNPYLQFLYKDIRQSIDSGHEMNMAMQKHPDFFSPFYINMIRVGEVSGQLEQILKELYTYIEFEEEMKNKAKAALRYPTIVFSIMTLAFIIIMVFVVPQFAKLYDSFKSELPWATLILINVSNFMVKYGLILIPLLVLLSYGFKLFIKSEDGKPWWDKLKFSFPIIGIIIKKSVLARFSKSFSLAFKSGIPIVQTLGLITKIVDNKYLETHIEQIRENVERGNSLYNSMRATGVFEPLVLEMISAGEESGELDTMTKEVSHLYETEIEYELKSLSDKIEPIMLLIMGVFLVIFALGVFLPIWDLSSVVIKKN